LGFLPIQQVWHIQIREKAGDIADVIRQNLAMAFMMLTFVELRVREGGGVGVLLEDLHKSGKGYDMILRSNFPSSWLALAWMHFHFT
jgi:hypothetical protein